jgi:hypothetical protein
MIDGKRVRIAFPLPDNRDVKGMVGTVREIIGSSDPELFTIEPAGTVKVRGLMGCPFQEIELRVLP